MAQRILIADDCSSTGDVMRYLLQKNGYDVGIAVDGIEAFEMCQAHGADLVITDYQMPGLNGAELCEKIRALPGMADIPILICSGKCLEIDQEHLKNSFGVSEFIRKPFSPFQLRQKIEDYLASPQIQTA